LYLVGDVYYLGAHGDRLSSSTICTDLAR
jgi:hypothetical protein